MPSPKSSRRKADAAAAPLPASLTAGALTSGVPAPNFTLRVDVYHHNAADDLVVAAIQRVEDNMAKSFKKLMEEMHAVGEDIKAHKTAADEAEVAEDEAAAKRDADNAEKIAAAEAKIAELQAKIDTGTLSDAQEAEATQAIADLRVAAGLDGEPAPEPAPETPPADGGTGGETELPTSEQP